MRSFYGQRCGTAVDLGPEFPGLSNTTSATWMAPGTRPPARPASAPQAAAGTMPATTDATWSTPDSPPARCSGPGKCTARNCAHVKLNLPETGNGTPDLLNEIRWNLEWMLTMQDDDGGVWHKQTSESFCGLRHAGERPTDQLRDRHRRRALQDLLRHRRFRRRAWRSPPALYKPFDAASRHEVSARRAAGLDLAPAQSRRPFRQSRGRLHRRVRRRQLRRRAPLGRRRTVAHERRRGRSNTTSSINTPPSRTGDPATDPPAWPNVGTACALDLRARRRQDDAAVRRDPQGLAGRRRPIVERTAANGYRSASTAATTSGARTASSPTTACSCWWRTPSSPRRALYGNGAG